MRNLFVYIWKQYFFFLFLILEVIAFSLFFQNNAYQRAFFINSANSISGGIYSRYADISEYFSLKAINKNLAEENARYRTQLKSSFLISDKNVFTKNDTSYRQHYDYISAKVINNSVNRRNNFITLNKGFAQGVRKDMAVITPNGVMGIVKEVTSNFSSVISVLHKDSKISAKIKKNEQVGTIVWEGDDYRFCFLKDIPTHVKPHVGDTIITSGYSGIFPEGIFIGKVYDYYVNKGENFYTLKVKFEVDYNNITYVYVIKNLLKDEQRIIEEGLPSE
jgi:rod shape-determining protein MreC